MFQIGRIVWTLLSIFILAAAGSIAESLAGDDADKVKGYTIGLYVIGGFLLVYNVFFIIFSSLLFHGARNGKPRMILPWMILSWLTIISQVVGYFWACFDGDNFGVSPYYFVGFLIKIAVEVYIYIGISSYW